MTIKAFVQAYTLHDSLVKQIVYDRGKMELRMKLDFCWWMQKDFDDDRKNPEIVELAFTGVPAYQGLQGEVDDYSVLDMETNGSEVTITLLDDIHDQPYELTFCADAVSMRGKDL